MAFEQKESIYTPWKVNDPKLMQIRIYIWEKDMAEKYFILSIDLFRGKILENKSFAGNENFRIESPTAD